MSCTSQIGDYLFMGRRSKVCVATTKSGHRVALKAYLRKELSSHDMYKVRYDGSC